MIGSGSLTDSGNLEQEDGKFGPRSFVTLEAFVSKVSNCKFTKALREHFAIESRFPGHIVPEQANGNAGRPVYTLGVGHMGIWTRTMNKTKLLVVRVVIKGNAPFPLYV